MEIFVFLLTSFVARNMEIPMFLSTKLVEKNMQTFNQICLKISTFYLLKERCTQNIDIFDRLFNFLKEESFKHGPCV